MIILAMSLLSTSGSTFARIKPAGINTQRHSRSIVPPSHQTNKLDPGTLINPQTENPGIPRPINT
jgi:hypothetical protein